jgi:hypothetical protein
LARNRVLSYIVAQQTLEDNAGGGAGSGVECGLIDARLMARDHAVYWRL